MERNPGMIVVPVYFVRSRDRLGSFFPMQPHDLIKMNPLNGLFFDPNETLCANLTL
jgi:hypothetical protein